MKTWITDIALWFCLVCALLAGYWLGTKATEQETQAVYRTGAYDMAQRFTTDPRWNKFVDSLYEDARRHRWGK